MSGFSSDKDRVLSSLLQPKPSNHPPNGRIQEIGKESVVKKNKEEPTMLELMMAEQAKAKKEHEKEQGNVIEKEISTSFSKGFKKGFLSSNSSSNSSNSGSISKKIAATEKSNLPSNSIIASNESKESKETIPTVSKKKDTSLVIDEVQNSLKDDNPILEQLKGGDWITNNLKEKIASNSILAKGLSNPKCLAAIELMQKNPNEAKKRFASDPDVELFMKEFGKMMSEHFFSLAQQNGQSSGSSTESSTESSKVVVSTNRIAPIQEIGPIHADIMKKQKDTNLIPETSVDDSKVKEILEDPELRSMLLDPELQQILQECNDPIKFQRHMQNPEIARKIKKLFQAGLVGTTS